MVIEKKETIFSMSRKKPTNLKQKLLQAAEKRIQEGGTESLSLRKLAVDVGVTTMATYHHFANKKALLIQISINGFNALYDELTKNLKLSDSSEQAINKIMKGYFKFAKERPDLYHLMFSFEMSRPRHTIPELIQAAQRGFFVLADAVKGNMEANGHIIGREAAGECFWAILHGRVCMVQAGSVIEDMRKDTSMKALIDAGIKNIFHIQ